MIDHAEGTNLYDTDGNAYIDGVSSLWCNVHGHRHPAIDAAIRAQLGRVAHSTMLGLSHEPAIELAERLVAIAPPGLTRVFYSDSGSTAVEVALKMAFQWWAQRGETERTGSSASRTPTTATRSGRCRSAASICSTRSTGRCCSTRWQARAGDAAHLEPSCSSAHGDEVAAVIVEPLVQGAAGMLMQPDGYLRRVRELLRRARRAADLRRGRDRLRPHRADVRLRARGGRAGPAVRRQGDHRRLPAARRDARHRADLRGLPRAAPRSSGRSSTATRTPATRWPARPRSRRSRRSSASGRSSCCSPKIELLARTARAPGRRAARASPRCASAGSWSGSSCTEQPAEDGSATR